MSLRLLWRMDLLFLRLYLVQFCLVLFLLCIKKYSGVFKSDEVPDPEIQSDPIAHFSVELEKLDGDSRFEIADSSVEWSPNQFMEKITDLSNLGLKECSTSVTDLEVQKYFDETVYFSETEKRYMVKWPYRSELHKPGKHLGCCL